MGKKWEAHQGKKFARELKLGTKYYTVNDHATNLAPWHDEKTYSVHVFTGKSGFTAVPMTDGGTSAVGLCQRQGPVYDAPPRGLRNIAGPAPQVDGPLPKGYVGDLDPEEADELERGMRKSRGFFW